MRIDFARLNHILIPKTKEELDRFRTSRIARVLFPIVRSWGSFTDEGRTFFIVTLIAWRLPELRGRLIGMDDLVNPRSGIPRIGTILIIPLVGYAKVIELVRRPVAEPRATGEIDSLLSREFMFLLNNWILTSMFVFVRPTVTFRRCKFGLNCRRAMPVTLVPTPPKYFALPRVVTRFPMLADLPQTPHARAIANLNR